MNAPEGLLQAMDVAVAHNQAMRPEHVLGVSDWLHEFMMRNIDDPVTFSIDEFHLICKALSTAVHHAYPQQVGS
jgi:hypothetical protein